MSSDVTKDLLDALLNVARMAENLKKPCGTDPESPQAIQNTQYMNISYAARAAIARAEAALAAPQPDAGLIGVQWWLAELDRYGNAKLVDGQHSGRAGADKAMYLIKALHLDAGRRFAVARVELSEPKPRGDGVNHEAIKTLNDARREAQP